MTLTKAPPLIDGGINATHILKPGEWYDTEARPLRTRWAGIAMVGIGVVSLDQASVDPSNGVAKGIISLVERGGTCRITRSRVGFNPMRGVSAFQHDPESRGPAELVEWRDLESHNGHYKIAQARRVIAEHLSIKHGDQYGMVWGEGVEDAVLRHFDFENCINTQHLDTRKSKVLDMNSLFCASGRVAHHHRVRAKRAVWEDIVYRQGDKVAISDDTPSAVAELRTLRRCHFHGAGLPYFAKKGCGGPVEAIDCTWNDKPWTPGT